MSLFDVMDVASTSLTAQTVRLHTIAENMANANTVSSTADDTYRAKAPVFKAILEGQVDPMAVSYTHLRAHET